MKLLTDKDQQQYTFRKNRKVKLQNYQRSSAGDNLDSEEPPASYIVKLTAGNSTHFEDFEVEINSELIMISMRYDYPFVTNDEIRWLVV